MKPINVTIWYNEKIAYISISRKYVEMSEMTGPNIRARVINEARQMRLDGEGDFIVRIRKMK